MKFTSEYIKECLTTFYRYPTVSKFKLRAITYRGEFLFTSNEGDKLYNNGLILFLQFGDDAAQLLNIVHEVKTKIYRDEWVLGIDGDEYTLRYEEVTE